jgi:hypothetical protein
MFLAKNLENFGLLVSEPEASGLFDPNGQRPLGSCPEAEIFDAFLALKKHVGVRP